ECQVQKTGTMPTWRAKARGPPNRAGAPRAGAGAAAPRGRRAAPGPRAPPPDVSGRRGRPAERLRWVVETVVRALGDHPNFLRLLVVMAAQPPAAGDGEAQAGVNPTPAAAP